MLLFLGVNYSKYVKCYLYIPYLGLYNKAILQSGVLDKHELIFNEHPLKLAKGLANILRCQRKTNEDMVNCLKTKSFKSLIWASTKLGLVIIALCNKILILS